MGARFLDQCRSNKGATGVDGQDFADIEIVPIRAVAGELALAVTQRAACPRFQIAAADCAFMTIVRTVELLSDFTMAKNNASHPFTDSRVFSRLR